METFGFNLHLRRSKTDLVGIDLVRSSASDVSLGRISSVAVAAEQKMLSVTLVGWLID